MPDVMSAAPNTGARWLALAGVVLATLFTVTATLQTWTLTTGAPLGWRVRVLLPDALVGLGVAGGCALAAWGARRVRPLGWGVVLLTLLGAIGWVALAVWQ